MIEKTTKAFVRAVNKGEIDAGLVKSYLASTLERGQYVSSAQSAEELRYIQSMGYSLTMKILTDIREVMWFFGFQDEKLQTLTKESFFKYVNEHVLGSYNAQTVERWHVGDGSCLPVYPDIEYEVGKARDCFDFMLANEKLFSREEVKGFIDEYVTVLIARNTMPQELFEPFWTGPFGSQNFRQLVQSDTYLHTNGVYVQEIVLLEKMSRFMLKNNFSCEKLRQAVYVGYEKNPETWQESFAKDKSRFLKYRDKIYRNMSRPNEASYMVRRGLSLERGFRFARLKKLAGLKQSKQIEIEKTN